MQPEENDLNYQDSHNSYLKPNQRPNLHLVGDDDSGYQGPDDSQSSNQPRPDLHLVEDNSSNYQDPYNPPQTEEPVSIHPTGDPDKSPFDMDDGLYNEDDEEDEEDQNNNRPRRREQRETDGDNDPVEDEGSEENPETENGEMGEDGAGELGGEAGELGAEAGELGGAVEAGAGAAEAGAAAAEGAAATAEAAAATAEVGAAAAGGLAAAWPAILAIVGGILLIISIVFGVGMIGSMLGGTIPTQASVNNSNKSSSAVVEAAKTQLGKPYVFGATPRDNWASYPGPPTGVGQYDCSSFTSWAWYWGSNGKVNLPSQSGAQLDWAKSGNGTIIDKKDLQPGDVLFFSTGGESGIHHVAIYVGEAVDNSGVKVKDGMIQAPTAHGTAPYVRINSLQDRSDFYTAMRPN